MAVAPDALKLLQIWYITSDPVGRTLFCRLLSLSFMLIALFFSTPVVQKVKFFGLANAYEHIEKTNNYHNDKTKVSLNYLKEHPKPYPEGVALKVIQITETNRFHNGVCLEMSRFNHSCVSNAEYFWNEDRNTRDVRAIKYVHICSNLYFFAKKLICNAT